jgi:YVTN family beta-propeller protein
MRAAPAAIAAFALAAGCGHLGPQAHPAAPEYKVVARYAVGGSGGWDYLSVDERRHRLYVSRGDHVQVVDARTGAVVGDVPGTSGVHGIAIAEDLGVAFTSNGRSDSVTVFDLATLAVLDTVKVTGGNPDAILYDAASHRVLTFNGRGANVTAIDARTRKVVGTLALSGKPEFPAADGHGHVFVNIEDRNTLAQIDLAGFAVAHEWPLSGCDEPTGLAIDREHGRLFSVCGNRKMVVVDAASGRVVQELPIGAGVDGAEFDPQLGLAFASNGEGSVTVVRGDAHDHYFVVQTVATQARARTVALEPSTHRLYLPTAEFNAPAPATAANPKPRPSMVPDSFVILVLSPAAS